MSIFSLTKFWNGGKIHYTGKYTNGYGVWWRENYKESNSTEAEHEVELFFVKYISVYNKIFSGYQPRQMVEWRKNQRFEDHLRSRPQGTKVAGVPIRVIYIYIYFSVALQWNIYILCLTRQFKGNWRGDIFPTELRGRVAKNPASHSIRDVLITGRTPAAATGFYNFIQSQQENSGTVMLNRPRLFDPYSFNPSLTSHIIIQL
jgi:hypothetical protein